MSPKLQVKLIHTIASLGGGMTHPDTVPPSGNGNPFDAYFSTYAGRIVSAPLVELTLLAGGRGHLFRDGTDCGGHPCTWTNVYDYAFDRLHAHYVFWPRMGWGEDRYIWERDLLPVLEAKKWAINTACPSNIRCSSRWPPCGASCRAERAGGWLVMFMGLSPRVVSTRLGSCRRCQASKPERT